MSHQLLQHVLRHMVDVRVRESKAEIVERSAGRTTYSYSSSDPISERLSRFTQQTLFDGDLGAGDRFHRTRLRYNGLGRVAQLLSASGLTGANSALDYSTATGVYGGWDRFGRVVKQEWKRGATVIDRFDYTYDFASNRLTRDSRVDEVAGASLDERDQTYTYDRLHRLQSSDEPIAANDRRWTYDQLGNWDALHHNPTGAGAPAETRTHNAANELTGFTTPATNIDPTHDAAGNTTTLPSPLAPSSSLLAKYDAWNRLVSLDDGSTAAYEYDGLHRRTKRTEAGVTTRFYYNERWQVLTETNASGQATAVYSYHPHYVDAVAVRMTPTTDHFYLHDALANVTALINNTSDTVEERYAYSPYGRPTVLRPDYSADPDNESDFGNELLYTGRRTDPGTGLQLNRYRYYHPSLGRWVNRDPIAYAGGDANLYGYVLGMPTGYVDPTGEFIGIGTIGAVAAVAAVAAAVAALLIPPAAEAINEVVQEIPEMAENAQNNIEDLAETIQELVRCVSYEEDYEDYEHEDSRSEKNRERNPRGDNNKVNQDVDRAMKDQGLDPKDKIAREKIREEIHNVKGKDGPDLDFNEIKDVIKDVFPPQG